MHVDQTGMEVEAGDLVFVKNDLQEVKDNQEGFGGWHPQMAEVSVSALTFISIACFDKKSSEIENCKTRL